MCILMEYAAYGSMKAYLAYCRRVMQAHAQGLESPTLDEAYPTAAISNGEIIRHSMLMGDYPQLQQLGVQLEGNDYQYDPMVALRTRRLIKMLQLEGYETNLPSADAEPSVYNRLKPLGNGEAAGASVYNTLYPQSQCVYRPCLETYNYACYRGAGGATSASPANKEQEYYNSLDYDKAKVDTHSPPVLDLSDSRLPLSPVGHDTVPLILSTQPETPSEQVKELSRPRVPERVTVTCNSTSMLDNNTAGGDCLSPSFVSSSQDNVFRDPPPGIQFSSNLMAPSREKLRESMISFPDGYIYAPASTMHGSCGDSEEGDGREEEEEEVVEKKELGTPMERKKDPPPFVEEMITYLDLLDFAVQIARGMDHLQKMQVRAMYIVYVYFTLHASLQ